MLQLSHKCDISRNAGTTGSKLKAMQSLYSGVSCLAIPMAAPTAVQNGFDLSRGYDFFFHDGQDVKVGDQLDWNGDVYAVRAVQRYQTPLAAHIHVLAEQDAN